MMSKRKWIYSIIMIFIVGFILFVYNAFNGNPMTKYLSKKTLEHYLTVTYPNKTFRLTDSSYNFKDQEYYFKAVEIGTTSSKGDLTTYDFWVGGFIHPKVNEDGLYEANLDQPLMNRLGKEAGTEVEQVLSSHLNNLRGVDAAVEVTKGKFPEDVKWSKQLPLNQPFGINVYLDSAGQSKQQFLQEATHIQSLLNENGYTYSDVNINGNIYFSSTIKKAQRVKFALSFKQNEAIKEQSIQESNK